MRPNTAFAAVALIALTTPAAAQNFQGAYIGFDVGSTSNKTTLEHSINKPNAGGGNQHQATINGVASLGGDMNSTSAIYGVAAGYDWRFSWVVVGAQLDIDNWGINDTKTQSAHFLGNGTPRSVTMTDTARASYMMAFRPRVGIVLGESTLLYASAGIVRTDLRYTNSTIITGSAGTQIAGSYEGSTTQKNGMTIGGGLEYVLPNKMGIRVDYQKVKFDRVDVAGPNGLRAITNDLTDSSINSGYKTSTDTIKVGLNWRF